MVVINETQEPGWTWVWTTKEYTTAEKHPLRGNVYRVFIGPFKVVELLQDEVAMSLIQGDIRGLKLLTGIARLNGLVG